MMFSIIIPVFNAESFLSQCIDSIRNQTFEDWEIIIVDDGSTDNSIIICDNYSKMDNRIMIIHQSNEGVSQARNVALTHAKGNFIIFVDSDDYVEPHFLETIQKEVQGYDIMFWGNQYHNGNGAIQHHQPQAAIATDRLMFEREILKLKKNPEHYEYFGFTWDKVFKREIIEKYHIRFTEKLSYREDELFTAEYCKYATTLKVIPSMLYHYRVQQAGLTAKVKSPEVLNNYLKILENQISYWQLKELRDYETSRYANVLFRLLYSEKGIMKIWGIAKKINSVYVKNRQNQQLIKSRVFSLPSPIFAIILPVLIFLIKNSHENR